MVEKKKTVKAHAKKLSLARLEPKIEYDQDFFNWTKKQASLLKNGRLAELDVDNLVEEIESLGRNDKRALRSYTIVLLLHLLKKKFQPDGEGNSDSWNASILNARREIKFLLEDSPSLKNELKKLFPKAYTAAREEAAVEAHLDIKKLPIECPWTIQEVLA